MVLSQSTDKCWDSGEPIRVKQGERVLFHVLNGSATEIRSLGLPGHTFKVIAVDGNPVPHPAEVAATLDRDGGTRIGDRSHERIPVSG